MIDKQDIKNLADLSRIEITDEESTHLAKEIDSILGYISQIKDTTGNMEREIPSLHNVLREDIPTNASHQYTEKLIKNSPVSEGESIKVKKIL